MAKHKHEKPEEQPESEPLPEVVAEPRVVLPLWAVKRKSEAGEPQLIEAETLEDAIRAFNGSSGMAGPNDLTVERV